MRHLAQGGGEQRAAWWGRKGESVLSGGEEAWFAGGPFAGGEHPAAAPPCPGEGEGAAPARAPLPRYLPERLPVPPLHEAGVPARREVGAETPEAAELLPLPGGGLPGVEHTSRRGYRPPRRQQQEEEAAAPRRATTRHATTRPAA